uniref:Uncharacterized protein n=1 Tax=Lotharella globosa TaxID=91324 RepID=A0A7S3YVH9_9EUKA|mmetsp:Transcript_19697/g.37950  ORF Transcript_19697/g.37950 Transcript_19697/m.37950 type:complete len:302 (-) Transcript_19697:75-980(-)|eukprot:CAMPEP_0167771996 /NCGR_PEP_ID=MMETSP0111_2-20121227/597_1 /TAXON_ID=91324 /ORGANISM="Lotharella globosa, Strain CCCM811" /LENGTH=301 /DNA_ID=CAMNT_0007661429 /DNA_START=184 /DNA_END=1089 /DNA_ORIENTATION=-
MYASTPFHVQQSGGREKDKDASWRAKVKKWCTDCGQYAGDPKCSHCAIGKKIFSAPITQSDFVKIWEDEFKKTEEFKSIATEKQMRMVSSMIKKRISEIDLYEVIHENEIFFTPTQAANLACDRPDSLSLIHDLFSRVYCTWNINKEVKDVFASRTSKYTEVPSCYYATSIRKIYQIFMSDMVAKALTKMKDGGDSKDKTSPLPTTIAELAKAAKLNEDILQGVTMKDVKSVHEEDEVAPFVKKLQLKPGHASKLSRYMLDTFVPTSKRGKGALSAHVREHLRKFLDDYSKRLSSEAGRHD